MRDLRSQLILLSILLGAILPAPAAATRGGEPGYPRTASYAYAVGNFTPAQRDTLAWHDLVVCRETPATIAGMRARNPHQRIFHIFMPQSIVSYNDEETFWHADTSWSLDRLCQFYAQQNDWYLYDIFGEKIRQWGCWVANWTPHCPLGVYGTSKGMTYAQWYIDVALPQIAFHSLDAWGEPWGWGSSAYDGIAWETLYECPACCEADQFRYADPDRDGEPEGIEGTCFDGGDDTLRRLYREVNDDFFARLQSALPLDFVINTNRGGVSLNPTWAWEMNGLKLEDWNPSRTNPARSWWSWMYGRRGYGGAFIGDGYEFAERVMHRSGVDELDGWDVSWLMLWTRGAEWPPAYKARMQRFGLGTTMLGDGYFIFTIDQHYPTWFEALDWDFGAPLEGFQKETATGDTLYVRRFEKGVVEVNPYPRTVQGVAVEDARFSFWLTISDLMVDDAGADHVMLRWVVPSSQVNGIQSTEIRYAEFPITPENWDAATPAPSGPVAGSPGETIRYSVRELPAETTFHFAAKNTVRGRLEPLISNVVSAVTGPAAPPPPPEEDTTPPAAIVDLASVSRGQSWIDLRWTAPGDDGMSGTAEAYELRYRIGAAIGDEGDWNAASPAGGLPEPAAAGSIQQFRLSGLQPGTGYGVALRASDEAGNVAGLSNPLAVATLPVPPPPPPPEEDPLPPAPVGDLALLDSGDTWALLGWSCPGEDGESGRADHFVLGLLAGLPIDSEERWAAADTSAEGLPDPGEPGEPVTYLLAGLAPGAAYGVAVRAGDEAGRRSALGNGLLVETSVPPDTIPPAAIADLGSPAQGPNWIELLWTAPGDDGDEGAAARYLLRFSAGGAINDEEGWAAADSAASPPEPAAAGEAQGFRLEGLEPATLYGIALRAEDGAGNLSPLGPAFTALTTAAADTIAPAAIEDLAVAVVTADRFDLVWTAPGGDGAEGTAAEYILGRRAGAAIADAAGWAAAERETLVAPLPLPAGTPQGCSLRGLAPDTIYGLAVRAVDEAGNVGPLPATPLVGRTLAALDTIPPAAVTDLALLDVGEGWLDLFWSAPGGDGMEGRATSFALAWSGGTQPIDTEERWQAARIQTAGLPAPPEPGMPVSWRLSGLAPASDYAVAVRAYDEQGLAGGLSNPLVARTLSPPPPPPPPPPDEPAAPASIEDLVLAALGPDWAELRWSCPGGDGPAGEAERFVLGWRAGAALEGEEDWSAADTTAAGLPDPGPPGSAVEYRLEGLAQQALIRVAVRAYDAQGRRSALGAPLAFETPAPPDTVPPGRVTDLAAALDESGAVRLDWTAAGDDGHSGTASLLVVARRADQVIESEEDWLAARKDTLAATVAGGEPETLLVAGLSADASWGFALRYVDGAGSSGEISNFAALFVPGEPEGPAGPPAQPEGLCATSLGDGEIALRWSAGAGGEAAGETAGFIVATVAGGRAGADDWDSASHARLPLVQGQRGEIEHRLGGLEPGESYGIAVRAYGADGTLSAEGPAIWVPELSPGEVGEPRGVTDLRATASGAGWIELSWTSPEGGRAGWPVDRFEIACARAPFDPQRWAEAESVVVVDAGIPSAGGQCTLRIGALAGATLHAFALRADNGLGYRSAASNRVEAETLPAGGRTPAAPGRPVVRALGDGARARVSWDPVDDGEVAGYHVYGRSALMELPQRLNASLIGATVWEFALPPATEGFFVSVTAVGACGAESAPSQEAALFGAEVALAGPFPHPVEDEARFVLTLPGDPAGLLAVRGEIYSVSGLRVRRWIDEAMPAGIETTLRWDARSDAGRPVAPGLYFLRLTAGDQELARKIYVGR